VPATIEVSELHRRYGGPDGFEAVRGLSFEVGEGQLFALLGTNGAGKTSTLDVLEGLAAPSAGSVRVMGMDPWTDRRQLRPYTGIMLQSGGFPADLTVAETAQMWAGTLSDPRPVAEALELVSIHERSKLFVKQLSGGEKRRLDLALALLNRPKVLFLDEPTTGLDPESRHNTWELVRDIRDSGTTIVLTTHYLDEAQSLADHLAIMHAGKIIRTGTVTEVLAEYPAHISFETPSSPVPRLPGVTDVDSTRGVVTLSTTQLQQTLTELLSWAREQGVTLHALNATTASLDSVFMSVTSESGSQRESALQGKGIPQ
jgi:ABC-2 type transport system ATP-binding protein